jgi:hypothetical protein
MKDLFNIVRGAVSTKDLIPVLTHFAFDSGTLQGFNGRLAISTPAPQLSHLNCTVPAVPLLAALDAAGVDTDREPISLKVESNRLNVASTREHGANFNAYIPTGSLTDFPLAAPDPIDQRVRCQDNLLPILKALRPYVGEDASRPWVSSVLFSQGFATVTNNVMLVRTMTKYALLEGLQLPVFVMDELLRIGEEPYSYSQNENTVTFYYKTEEYCKQLVKETFIRCSLFKEGWPDAFSLFDKVTEGAKYTKIARTEPDTLLAAVEAIAPFCPDVSNPLIKLEGATVSTEQGDKSATVTGLKVMAAGTYRVEPLKLMLAVADKADWSKFPRVPFQGKSENGLLLQGILLGIQT